MFGFKKLIQKQVAKALVRDDNELWQALRTGFEGKLPLDKDSDTHKYIEEGLEYNTDVFGIFMGAATIFSRMKYRLVTVQKNGKEVDTRNPELEKLLNKPNFFQSGREFRMSWALFRYTTGNSIAYAPKLENGLNRGRINMNGLSMMPTQNVTPHSDGWRNPLAYYTLDIDEKVKISASDVWHERIPSLQYENGRNFMGLSPLKSAMNVINVQNAGMETAAKLYRGGHPPGIVNKEIDQNDRSTTTAEQEKKFRSKWKGKYQKDIDIPIFTMGKLNYTKIGYDNLKDMLFLEMDKNGRLKLCLALNLPPELFGASEPTYNNMQAAKKAAFENRYIPDFEQFLEGLNSEIVPAYGDRLKLVPDYSDIEVLQEDKERKAKVYQIGVDMGAYSPNDFREAMGDERKDDPALDEHYIGANRLPVSMSQEPEPSPGENDKFYQDRGIPDGM